MPAQHGDEEPVGPVTVRQRAQRARQVRVGDLREAAGQVLQRRAARRHDVLVLLAQQRAGRVDDPPARDAPPRGPARAGRAAARPGAPGRPRAGASARPAARPARRARCRAGRPARRRSGRRAATVRASPSTTVEPRAHAAREGAQGLRPGPAGAPPRSRRRRCASARRGGSTWRPGRRRGRARARPARAPGRGPGASRRGSGPCTRPRAQARESCERERRREHVRLGDQRVAAPAGGQLGLEGGPRAAQRVPADAPTRPARWRPPSRRRPPRPGPSPAGGRSSRAWSGAAPAPPGCPRRAAPGARAPRPRCGAARR